VGRIHCPGAGVYRRNWRFGWFRVSILDCHEQQGAVIGLHIVSSAAPDKATYRGGMPTVQIVVDWGLGQPVYYRMEAAFSQIIS